MHALLKAENMKIKHTIADALIWIMPVFSIVCCFFMSMSYVYGMTTVWWYTIFVYITIALFCALVHQKEQKKLQYRNIYQLPIPLKKIWQAKNMMIVWKLILTSNILGVLLSVAVFLLTGTVENGIVRTLVAFNLIWMLNIWQIPVYLWLAKKTGFYIPVLASAAVSVAGTILAQKSIWWACPMAWGPRLMCTVINYQPNGLVMTEQESALLVSLPVIAVITVAALALFVGLTELTAVFFERGQEKC